MFLSSALVVDEIRDHPEGGSVDLIGLREELYFDALPVLLERLSLFLEFVIALEDRGKRHDVEVRVIDPEGEVLVTAPLRFTLPANYARPTAPLDPTLFEVPFHKFGLHSIEIRLADVLVRRLPLFILPRDTPLAPSA